MTSNTLSDTHIHNQSMTICITPGVSRPETRQTHLAQDQNWPWTELMFNNFNRCKPGQTYQNSYTSKCIQRNGLYIVEANQRDIKGYVSQSNLAHFVAQACQEHSGKAVKIADLKAQSPAPETTYYESIRGVHESKFFSTATCEIERR